MNSSSPFCAFDRGVAGASAGTTFNNGASTMAWAPLAAAAGLALTDIDLASRECLQHLLLRPVRDDAASIEHDQPGHERQERRSVRDENKGLRRYDFVELGLEIFFGF